MLRTILSLLLVLLAILGVPLNAAAEQQVVLQSGAVLVGQLTMDGENLVLEVDGAKLQVPLSSVVTVALVKANSGNQAQGLLLKGLEAQLLFDGDKRALGLLAEAYRVAPEDGGVAFWYARSLVMAGFGKAANEVLQSRREAIALAYPVMVDKLATQIEKRLVLEKLPAALIKRIDQIEASASRGASPNAESDFYATYFQLIDQNSKPIAKSAFRVQGNGGQNESLESFADGYHLYTFNRRRSYNSQPCRVEISQAELAKESFEFPGARNGVENAGVFTVRRFTEEDHRKVSVLVVDPQGKPLADAVVTFSPNRSSRRTAKTPPVKTDDTGHASASLYPGHYNCTVTSKGYTRGTKQLEVLHEKKDPLSIEIKIYHALEATVKVAWRLRSIQLPRGGDHPAEAIVHGETELHTGSGGPSIPHNNRYGVVHWLRLTQIKDRMQLSFYEQHTGHPFVAGLDSVWFGRLENVVKASEGTNKDAKEDTATSAAEEFEAINLESLDELKSKATLPSPNLGRVPHSQPAAVVPAEKGAIYLGRIVTRNPQTGQPALVEFKVLVVEASDPPKSE